LAAWRPDVVHTTLFSGNLVGQLAARPLGLPVVSSFNRTGELGLQRALQPGVASWRGRVMQAVARHACRRGDVHFRAVSTYARDTNAELYDLPPAHVTVIPRGVAIDRAGIDPRRERFGLAAEGALFGNVARLVPEKGQLLLVEAFAQMRAELPGAQLAIAGAPGPAEPALRAAITRLGLDDAVHLLGFRADARSLVAAADVFAFSSLSEGWPSAVVEAMALATPVVAFAIPPLVEVTGGHARLVPTGSTEALGRAMVEAYRSPEREQEVRAAGEWAGQFDLAYVATQLGDLLESRAGARAGGAAA
jgi:glycosyltransferase involved in cell wall biosynthesis